MSEQSNDPDSGSSGGGDLFDVPEAPLTISKPKHVQPNEDSDPPAIVKPKKEKSLLKPDSMLGKRSRNEPEEEDYDEGQSDGGGSAAENE